MSDFRYSRDSASDNLCRPYGTDHSISLAGSRIKRVCTSVEPLGCAEKVYLMSDASGEKRLFQGWMDKRFVQ